MKIVILEQCRKEGQQHQVALLGHHITQLFILLIIVHTLEVIPHQITFSKIRQAVITPYVNLIMVLQAVNYHILEFSKFLEQHSQPLSQVLQSTNGIPFNESNAGSHHHHNHHHNNHHHQNHHNHHPHHHRISSSSHHHRGSSAHNSRSSSERPKPSTASSSNRKAASNSTHTIRRALQINDIEMKFNGTSPVGGAGVLTA